MKLEVHIPRPPSVNNLFVNGAKGRFPSKGYKEWQERAGMVLGSQLVGWETLSGPVKVSLMCDKKRGDLANYEKAATDLLGKHGVYEDDSQIVQIGMWHDKNCGDLMFIHVEEAE